MSDNNIPENELVEPEGFWPDEPRIVEEPPDLPLQLELETAPLREPAETAEPLRSDERFADQPLDTAGFDPETIENIGKPSQAPATPAVDPYESQGDSSPTVESAQTHANTDGMRREADHHARSAPEEPAPPQQPEGRSEPVPFETYIAGHADGSEPLVPDQVVTENIVTRWDDAPAAVEEVIVYTEEVPERTWLNDPPPPADPFSAAPYAPKVDDLWLGKTAPFDQNFDPSQFAPESKSETVRRGGLAWSAGIVFFSSVAFMLFLGWIADLLFGTSPFGMVGGIILGSVIGFIQFFRITSRIYSSGSSEIQTLMSEPTGGQNSETPSEPQL